MVATSHAEGYRKRAKEGLVTSRVPCQQEDHPFYLLPYSSLNIFTATSHDHYGLEDPGFVSLEGQDISFYPKLPDRACGPSIPLFNSFRSSVPGVMPLEREVNHSHPSSTDVKNEWSCTSTPTIHLYGFDRDNFTLLLHHRMYAEDVNSPA
jgi:hypothetical protein